ncbi:PREDICTED: coiled-coil domain-containing protein 149-like [Amphimedon queenslandica]|uniref:Uncharacterized protein n=1 Tax=Amphimedon queenslandica TaxID=400682 RepID=A0AAN0JRB0_AMPQE|nr:PREDICTED: coiled-coil domain-containing protein 149-like [Amphimedon queenslandica]|eukprot:XP_019859378.1 PREDICTED: coiled-coil domain-containing protein 149-like [Amphimedon queenslandica]
MASKKKGKGEVTISLEQYEALQTELSTCKRKLRSKEEAIRILHRELELSQEEKEEFSRLMNHMKDYYLEGQSPNDSTDYESLEFPDQSVDRVTQLEGLIKQLRHKHKEEVQSLKEKLSQARGVLMPSPASLGTDFAEEKARLISQLEAAQSQIMSLVREVQSLEDEKEEAMTERDAFAGKCNTLNKMLEERVNDKVPSRSTFEKLLDENRQLKLELIETQADRDSAINKIDRYKRTVERKKNRDTQNQAIQFMSSEKLSALRQSVRRVQELEVLANSLSEEVKEKSLALSHSRKTNRLLGTRIAELEHRLKVLEISGLWSTPDNEEDDIERGKQPAISWGEEEEEEGEEEVVLVEEDKNGLLVQGCVASACSKD